MNHSNPTIFALATPLAKSGVAVFRISGQGALDALCQLTRKSQWEAGKFTYSQLTTHDSRLIDQALCVYFKAPRSFTGEDVAEIHCHGSHAVIKALLEALAGLPSLRHAEAGEFTRRAFMNNKMDLLEAEGLADLIDADTEAQRAQALRQMGGDISALYEALRKQIITTLAHLEAYIDFPDEEIPETTLTGLKNEVRGVINTIDNVLSSHQHGEQLRSGLNIVILGAPNAGKSSLINYLSKREVAIVSPTAGTTRDMIEVSLNIAGYPAILVDTAGIRKGENAIEEEGVKRALARADAADIKLVLFDSTTTPDTESLALVDDSAIIVATKCDLGTRHEALGISVSTHTGEGVDQLLAEIQKRVVAFFSKNEAPMITRSRHRQELSAALNHLKSALNPLPLELQCEELRLAATSIGKITGKISVDDVLDVVFSEFCIGK